MAEVTDEATARPNGQGDDHDGLDLQNFGVVLAVNGSGHRVLRVNYEIVVPGDTNMRDANEINAKIEGVIFRNFGEAPPKSRSSRLRALRKAERETQAQLPTPEMQPTHWNGEPVAAQVSVPT